MKKSILIFALFLFYSNLISAQPPLGENHYNGFILTKKGKIEGIILRNGQDDKPWLDETLVGFIKMKDAKKLNKLKKKNFEKYKPKDILGYGFDDQLYLTRKYAASAKIGIKVLGRKWFLKTIVDGNLKVFTYYEQPSNVNLLGVSDAEKEAERDRIRKDFHILLQKGEGELQIIKKADIPALLADCPSVKEKYESGGFGFDPLKAEEKKGLGKIIARTGTYLELISNIATVAEEYNACDK